MITKLADMLPAGTPIEIVAQSLKGTGTTGTSLGNAA